jgi:hypothetical protein
VISSHRLLLYDFEQWAGANAPSTPGPGLPDPKSAGSELRPIQRNLERMPAARAGAVAEDAASPS